MNVIKLKYESREIGIADLLEKGIIIDEETWETPPIHSIVDLGNCKFDLMIQDIVLEEATFDEDGNELTPQILKVWDFGLNEIHPVTADHNFSGWELPNELILPNE